MWSFLATIIYERATNSPLEPTSNASDNLLKCKTLDLVAFLE